MYVEDRPERVPIKERDRVFMVKEIRVGSTSTSEEVGAMTSRNA